MQPIRKTSRAAAPNAQFQRDSAEASSGAVEDVCAELQSRGPNSVARMSARPTKRSQK